MISPDSDLAPVLLTAVLIALLVTLIVRAVRKDRREYQRFKRYRSTARRQRMFRKWLLDSLLLFGISSVVILVLAWQYVPLLLEDINDLAWVSSLRTGFDDSGGFGVGIVVGLVIAIGGGAVLAIVVARHADTVPAIGDIQSLLPRNRAELRYGAALSINAGVVEELLFRLGLPAILFGITGSGIAAVVASLLLFGLLHVYQGVAGIIGSTVIGALLMAVYLATGNILVAIIVHALIDLRSLVLIPMVVYKVHRTSGSAVRPAADTTDPVLPPL